MMKDEDFTSRNIISGIVEFNYKLNYPYGEYFSYEEECSKIINTLCERYNDKLNIKLSKYKDKIEELKKLDLELYREWIDKEQPFAYIGFKHLSPRYIVIFDKSFCSEKLHLFDGLIDHFEFHTISDEIRKLCTYIQSYKRKTFVNSIKGYKEFLDQAEGRHYNDINAIDRYMHGEDKINNYILSIIKEHDIENYYSILNSIFHTFSHEIDDLLDTISSLDKNDLVLSFRLNLKDCSVREQNILFFKYFHLHILSLYEIKKEKENK